MKKKILLSLLLWVYFGANALSQETIDEFLDRMTQDETEKEAFRCYYSEFLERQSKIDERRKTGKLKKLRQDALGVLQKKHPDLYASCIHSETVLDDRDEEGKTTRIFLTRYALYEDFILYKTYDRQDVWKRVKVSCSQIYEKVSGLFSNLFSSATDQIA